MTKLKFLLYFVKSKKKCFVLQNIYKTKIDALNFGAHERMGPSEVVAFLKRLVDKKIFR